MRSLAISVLLIAGCASTTMAARPTVQNGVVDLQKCEDLGRKVYNPRNPVLNPTESTGPSEVIWVHGRQGGLLTVHDGHVYRCGSAS